jgi:hypothetical protein
MLARRVWASSAVTCTVIQVGAPASSWCRRLVSAWDMGRSPTGGLLVA